MKKKFYLLTIVAMLILASCDDTTDTIGTSLTNGLNSLIVTTDTFKVASKSIISGPVANRNNVGYLGHIKDPETGTYVVGDFMTQFHTTENYSLPEESTIVSRENGRIVADSCEIRLYYKSLYGDSLATMKLNVMELDHAVEDGRTYYSDFDAQHEGYVRNDGINIPFAYTLTDLKLSDADRQSTGYINHITIPLTKKYTDKNGKQYNNFGSYVMESYYEHPEYFRNSYQMTNNVIPGFLFKHSAGLGSMAYISASALNIYFRYIENDSTYNGVITFAGTEEVLQTSKITNDNQSLNSLASDNSCTYLKTPAGLFTEITLPIDEIMLGHENDTINAAKLALPRINNETETAYTLPYPKRVLMIPTDSVKAFFEKDKTPDYEFSFIAEYSNTKSDNVASVLNSYTFGNIGALLQNLAKIKQLGLKNDPEWLLKHPNWNKVLIIPVEVTSVEDQNTKKTEITRVTHDMSLTSTKLIGGQDNINSPLQITVVYSKFVNR